MVRCSAEIGDRLTVTTLVVQRFAPPLVITRSRLDWALEQIEQVVMVNSFPLVQ